ncbi:MAG: response regulator, partial [Myxococcales bacterium]
MSGRILLIEPDQAARSVVSLALGADGRAVTAVASLAEARPLLDGGELRLAVVDEAAGDGALLDAVERLCTLFPRLPVLVTGALLTRNALLALLRLGVHGALLKPYSPAELRAAVDSALARGPAGLDGLEFAAAVALARRELDAGRVEAARSPSSSAARASSPITSASSEATARARPSAARAASTRPASSSRRARATAAAN